jgi:hypothetical protein
MFTEARADAFCDRIAHRATTALRMIDVDVSSHHSRGLQHQASTVAMSFRSHSASE